MRRRWMAATGAVVVAVAALLGGVFPAISQAEPPAAGKDFSKPAIVILRFGQRRPVRARCDKPVRQRRIAGGVVTGDAREECGRRRPAR